MRAAIPKIVELAGFHTLTLEIIARSLRARKGWSAQTMLKKVEKENFNIGIAVATAHSGDLPEDLLKQLEKLYEITSIEGDTFSMNLLKNFAVPPYLPLSAEDVIRFLELDNAQENKPNEAV
jgi:acetolactate synthase regulatory subunit